MDTVDGYLSHRVQTIDPRALVYRDETGAYRLELPGESSVGLGTTESEARLAVHALLRAHHAQRD